MRCRYGFPRKAVDEIGLNLVKDTVTSRYAGKRVCRLYDLPRVYNEERFINDYQPDLLWIWGGGNMDFQFVGEVS